MALKKIIAVFYALPSGREPVRDFLKNGLSDSDRKVVGQDIATAEYGWPLGMPICKAMGNGLYEIRSHISQGRISRVLFGIVDGQMVLLHGFIKKSQKTAKKDIDLALKRYREI